MQSRYTKLVVKDGSGNFIQLLPETKVDGSINPNSSNPPSGAAVAAWGGTFVSKTGNEAVSGQKTFAEGPYGTSVALSGTSIDLSAGSVFTKTISANTTFSISNAPTGKASQFILILENGGAYTVTWPNSVVWAGGQAPALATAGKNVLRFMTPNGTDWFGCMDGSGSGDSSATEYVGATSNANGTAGLVPSALSAQKGNYLRGDGSWNNVAFSDAVALSGSQIDPNLGNCFTKTITANTTFTITNANIPSGKTAMFTLILINGGSKTITWPSGMKWPGGNAPGLNASGTDILTFLTPDGGTTWYGTLSMAGVA